MRGYKIVAITGLPGAGKSTVADFFVAKGYQYIRFGQIVLDIVKERGLEPNEKNESKVRVEVRKKHGMAAMAILNLAKIKKLLRKGNVLVDGLYSFEEYEVLKKEFGKKVTVLAVFAPPSIRYKRISSRVISKDDNDLRNRPFTVKEAMARDIHELQKTNKGPTIAMADYTILNNKDKKFLLDQLEDLVKSL